MPNWAYSVKEMDPERSVKCSGRELRISPKAATEICRAIRGMRLDDAKRLPRRCRLQETADLVSTIQDRSTSQEPRSGGMQADFQRKLPTKMLGLLEELQSNAEYKGLDVDRLRIIHAASQRGMKTRNYVPRAFGRSSPSFNTLTHIELIGYEAQA